MTECLSSLIQTAIAYGSDPGMTNIEAVSEMLKPIDARQMRCYPVSTRINHVANDDVECSAPVELTESQAGLFSEIASHRA